MVPESAFDYRLRVSARARIVRLCVSLDRGLEVVVPRGFDRRQVPQVLTRKAPWIRRALERIDQQRRLLALDEWRMPERIEFPATGAEWKVHAEWRPGARVYARVQGDGVLAFRGPIDREPAVRALLGRFLMVQAREHLARLLEGASLATGLDYTRVSVRRQRTRWGSCSAHGAISLNAALLFLPAHLTYYVLVHELCHTVHLNHSQRFWRLVERHCAEYRSAERELRTAWMFVPHWARHAPAPY